VAVIFIGRLVVLPVGQRLELAVRRIAVGYLVRLVGRSVSFGDLDELTRGVVAVLGDPVRAEEEKKRSRPTCLSAPASATYTFRMTTSPIG
jgi:hypothetical protein